MTNPSFQIDATRGYLQAGETRLSYLDWGGEGRPALMLHGITSSAATLWQLAPALRSAGFRPVALDMPGHGKSDVSPDHAIDTIAGLAGTALEHLGMHDALLIGHSWGGATALALAGGEHPARARLARVVLIDPLLALSAERATQRLPAYLEGLGEPAALGTPRVQANNPDWQAADWHWKGFALEDCRAEQVRGLFQPREDWSLIERLGRVALPLLILVADPAHSIIPPDRLDEVRDAMHPRLGALAVVPGTTHNMLRGPGYADTLAALMGWLVPAPTSAAPR